ncbi:MAG: DUF6519 domain-containing protein [Pyrinomonadaceae bacterium]
MGNFSRDPKARIADSINKHYVAIPLQQAVPLLDADWNELENLRRHQHETLGTRFIGSGVPEGEDGFRIIAVNNDNDFSIKHGMILVNGKVVTSDADTRYSTQPNVALVPPLVTPVADSSFIAYLDVFEREVDSQEDPDLVDNRIGVETCLRLKREWVVRVIAGDDPQNLPAPPAGRDFYPLALIKRKGGNNAITFPMLNELRRLHLTLASSTKAVLELYGAQGNLIFTLDNFAEMLNTTERAYFNILRSDVFMAASFATASPLDTVTLSALFNEVMQTATASSIQAKIRNLNNQDGLKVLQSLYDAQDHLVTLVTPLAAGNPNRISTANLMTRLRQLLDGAPGVPGLKPSAFTTPDLDAAIKAQQEINRELGNRTQILPHGRIEITFVSGPPPATIITAGQTFRYQFNVTFVRTTPGPVQEETFDVLPALDPAGWTATLVGNPQNKITLQTEESVVVSVDVTIPAVPPVNSATLKLQVRSRLNPTEMNTTNAEVALTVGASGAQPAVLHVDLFSPAINVATDTLPVGRGGPTGLPGKAKNLTFKFTYDEIVGAPVDFTVKFVSTPPNTFEDIPNVAFQLGGVAGQTKQSAFTLAATPASVNGTLGKVTVSIAKNSDANVSASLPINLQVQKS